MEKKKTIFIDMDGTIADTFQLFNWKEYNQKKSVSSYVLAPPLVDIKELYKLSKQLKENGWEVKILTMSARDALGDLAFMTNIKTAKIEWLKFHGYNISKYDFMIVSFGTIKSEIIDGSKLEIGVLIDDSESQRENWKHGLAIDPTKECLLGYLRALCKILC